MCILCYMIELVTTLMFGFMFHASNDILFIYQLRNTDLLEYRNCVGMLASCLRQPIVFDAAGCLGLVQMLDGLLIGLLACAISLFFHLFVGGLRVGRAWHLLACWYASRDSRLMWRQSM